MSADQPYRFICTPCGIDEKKDGRSIAIAASASHDQAVHGSNPTSTWAPVEN